MVKSSQLSLGELVSGAISYLTMIFVESIILRTMKFSYDPKYNIAYIRLRAKSAEVMSIKVSDELIVDLAPDGTVYGIEFLNASEQLIKSDAGKLEKRGTPFTFADLGFGGFWLEPFCRRCVCSVVNSG